MKLVKSLGIEQKMKENGKSSQQFNIFNSKPQILEDRIKELQSLEFEPAKILFEYIEKGWAVIEEIKISRDKKYIFVCMI